MRKINMIKQNENCEPLTKSEIEDLKQYEYALEYIIKILQSKKELSLYEVLDRVDGVMFNFDRLSRKEYTALVQAITVRQVLNILEDKKERKKKIVKRKFIR